jgi:hypothetical protein
MYAPNIARLKLPVLEGNPSEVGDRVAEKIQNSSDFNATPEPLLRLRLTRLALRGATLLKQEGVTLAISENAGIYYTGLY